MCCVWTQTLNRSQLRSIADFKLTFPEIHGAVLPSCAELCIVVYKIALLVVHLLLLGATYDPKEACIVFFYKVL